MKNKLIFLMSNWYKLTDYEWEVVTVAANAVREPNKQVLTEDCVDGTLFNRILDKLNLIYEKHKTQEEKKEVI